MMGDLRAHLPTPCWVFSSFWPKMVWPPCVTLPIHHISPPATFCFPGWKKFLKGQCFCQCGRDETKSVRSTKWHQNGWVQKLFWAVEKISRLVCCNKWRALWRWLKFKHVRMNTQCFINKFQVFGASPFIWWVPRTDALPSNPNTLAPPRNHWALALRKPGCELALPGLWVSAMHANHTEIVIICSAFMPA